MLKFFRRIRQSLLSENKFTKYLIYAIGEIALVMIGILLALQVSNWNEIQKNKAFEKEILMQIRANLIKDKLVLDEFIKNADNAVLSIDKILNTNITTQKNDSIKYWLGNVIRFDRFRTLTNAYEVLKSKGLDQITNKQLRFLLGMYYDDQSVAMALACKDLEIMFINDWIPVLKKNVVEQIFGELVDLENYNDLKPGGEIRNLLILNRDNWGGSNETLNTGANLIEKILSIINDDLND